MSKMSSFLSKFLLCIVLCLLLGAFLTGHLKESPSGLVPMASKLNLTSKLNSTLKLNLTIRCDGGRLGNQLFRYACLFGLALKNNRQGVVPLCLAKYLQGIFNLTLPVGPNLPRSNGARDYPVHYVTDVAKYYRIPDGADVITGAIYKNSYVFVEHVGQELRKELTFKGHLREHARKRLEAAKGELQDATLVGVHVRRTDYINYLAERKRTVAPMDYFKKALDYYREKLFPVVFVVVSDDLEWCRKNFDWPDVRVLREAKEPEYDLALLSACNHSVIDYGTFGWWGAFLAGGQTVYYVDDKERQMIDSGHPGLFFLPRWHGIS